MKRIVIEFWYGGDGLQVGLPVLLWFDGGAGDRYIGLLLLRCCGGHDARRTFGFGVVG